MIWLLAALMQLSASLAIESVTPTADGVAVVLRNTSTKTITGFILEQREHVNRIRDLEGEGISPRATYRLEIPTGGLPDQVGNLRVIAVVFADDSTEGEKATGLLARREGATEARRQTARQVRAFLEFNTVFDDSAMASLDRELDMQASAPAKWLSNHEKHSFEAGYVDVLNQVRRNLAQSPQNHRREQLDKIGGAR